VRRALLVLALALAATPAFAQKARAPEGMSEPQRADYGRLMRGYLDTFRLLGRSKLCGLDFDAAPFFREVEQRHGAKSEPARLAAISYAAGAENLVVSPQVDPAPPAPMPCDVVALMRGGMRLPPLPPSLIAR
jgi:hypothetical protein